MALKLIERGIYSLISSIAGGQVYAMQAPQNVSGDFVIYQKIDSDRFRSINAPSGLAQATIQIDSYSQDFFTAKENGALIEQALDGYRGVVNYDVGAEDFVDIGGITLQNESDVLDQTDEPQLYRNTLSFLITYKQ